MRRTLALATIAAISLAACGGSDSDATGVSIPEVPSSESGAALPVDTSVTGTGAPVTAPADTCVPDGETTPEVETGDAGPPPTNPDKPSVDTPTETPTELVRTVLTEGNGADAAEGDTVIVDYVGVRSDDGLEFDNSYDRNEPFPVTVGRGSVIQGWDEGLVGAKSGERVQLDIPSALAYGDTARPPIICENEDLTFVIDVRAIVKAVDPGDVPTEPGVPLSTGEGATETASEDIAVGDGSTLELGQTALIRYVNFRGDNGVAIETSWDGDPVQIPFEEGLLPGLLTGMEGMQVGGRRAITIPPEDGFGPDGNPQGGLPADTDMIFLIELLGVY